ncbi:MAG TPA: hypothetical protein VIK87_08770, partial [Sphingomonadales bacterium]
PAPAERPTIERPVAPAPRPQPAPQAAQPAPQPAPRPAAPAPQREAAPQQSGSRGWLSDLLVRASRDEGEAAKPAAPAAQTAAAPANQRRTIELLDSISVDIARMIDHDAAVELWDRYKRGERNVFTRRLYTLQGQQTFEEIRRKYRQDAEFRETVDRYIDEFERLLAEVSRQDRDSMMAKTYLTSETGKVYTMLAHATGRFE